MAKLYFRIQADYDKVIKLREEIARLKLELKNVDSAQSPSAFNLLNTKLGIASQEFKKLTHEAAEAGTAMENDFKKGIFNASQSVNDFTQKIINQKAVVKDTEADVKRLGEAYRTALKRNPLSANSKLADYTSAKKALDEDKAALFQLTQQQAEARLSVKKLRDEYALYNNSGKQVTETNNGIAISWKKALAVIGGATALKQLGSEIIRVRGEFQAMQTAIETLVGKDMAGNLIPKIKELAKVSPLTLSDMVAAEKMMLGFNIKAEDTIRYLQALGDISMGDSQKFNSLTLAFSQMSAAGKLMGQDLNQMINAGFNPLQTISEKTGKSIATLKDEMSKGAVSAEMVQQAFVDATSAGGKFYQMSENASKTINGQISMMQDALDEAFNEMGTKSEGIIMSGIKVTTSLIENYETVGKVLTGLVVTYGTYRTAVMLTTIATSKHTIAEIALTNARVLARKAQLALNAAMLTNPYVLLATAVVGLGAAMWAFRDSTTAAEKAQKRFNEQKEGAIKQEQDHKQELEKLISAIQNEYTSSFDRIKAMDAIKANYPSLFQKYIDEKGHIKDLIGLWKEYNEEVSRGKIKENKGNFDNSKNTIEEYEKIIGLWNKFGEDPNFHKNSLSNSEKLLANKYKDETLSTLKSKLDEERIILIDYQKEVRSDELAQWQLDLKKNTDIQVKTELDEMKRLQQVRKNNKHYSLNVGVGSLKGATTESELQQRISVLESELSSRNPKFETKNKSYWEKKKKEAETARDALDVSKKNSDDWNKYTKQIQEAEKNIALYSSPSKQDSAAEKLRKEQEKHKLLLSKQALEEVRANEDLQMQVDEANIKRMDEGSKKTIAQMQHNFKKEMQAIDRQKEDALRKKIEDARSAWEADPENKKKSFDATGIKLSDEENKKYDALYKAQTESFEKEKLRTEALAMREYLKEYGTFQQQKLAIAEEYAEKIKNAQSESERLTFGKQRDAALLNTDVQAAKQDIDWQSVFGDLGMMLKEQIQPTIDNLKTVIQSKEFQNSSIEDQQKIYDLLSDLEKQSGTFGKDMFKDVSRDLQLFRNSLNAYNEAKKREIKAANDLATAQERLKKAQENGEDTTSAQQAVDNAQVTFNQASESVRTFSDKVNENAENLHNSSEKARGALEGLASGLNKLKSGSLQQAFDGVKDIGKTMNNKLGDAISKIDPTGLISGVLGILDILKDGLSSIFVSLQDTMYGVIEGLLNDVYSGDIITKPLENSIKHMGSILDTITFGGFKSIFGSNGNSKEINAIVDRLTDSNKYLVTAIDKLTDEMGKSGGKKSTEYYESAHEKQIEKVENDRQMLEAKMKYNSSHHSNNYYINKAFNADDWKKASDYVGTQMKSAGDLWELSPEDLAKLQELPDIWNKIHSGKYDQSEWLDAYVEDAGALEELTEKWHESLNQTSFDTFQSSFLDTLMDMDASSEDFADNFEEYLKKSILSALIADNYADDIKELYDEWAKAGEDGEYSEDEINRLRKKQDDLSNKMLADRNAIADAMGWESDSDSSREASQKGIATASQDSVDENNGRLTVIQEHIFNLNENVTRIATGIDSIVNHTANLSCLTNIDKTMQSLLTMREQTITHLANIDNHTSNLVEMRNDMHSMKQDISTMLIKGLKLSKN